MSTSARRDQDARRRKAQPWRKWYSLKKWKLKREAQLQRVPWCEPCKVQRRSRRATIANHKIPHRGDPLLFWHGELESCCKACHDSMIQRAEAVGFRPDHDDDGWPIDPAHPFNRMEARSYDTPRSPDDEEGNAPRDARQVRAKRPERGHRDPSR